MPENNEFKLDSGAVLLVTMAPFEDCKDLHDCVVRTFLQVGATEKDLLEPDMIKLILTAGASKELEYALFKCGERAVYRHDGKEGSSQGVTKSLFDVPIFGEKARKDYYPIFLKIAEVNLSPFMQALFSALRILHAQKAVSPEQK